MSVNYPLKYYTAANLRKTQNLSGGACGGKDIVLRSNRLKNKPTTHLL